MKPMERCALLVSQSNPDATLDYVSGLKGKLRAFGHGEAARVNIHYVPDRLIVEPASFGRYLEALTTIEWPSLEALATAILSDFNNELIARWVRVRVMVPEGAYPGVGSHEVMVEDQLPTWGNETLLSRLPDS